MTKSIVLVGLMGSGKTAIGTLLAEEVGLPFVDSDEEIERAANMSISEIFARDGEPFFREKESLVLKRLLMGPPCILSTGGGAFMSRHNRELILQHGLSVWLDADLEILWARVKGKDTRPLLQVPDPKAKLAELLHQRLPHYQQAQVHVKAVANQSKEDMTQRVLRAVLADPQSGIEEGADA